MINEALWQYCFYKPNVELIRHNENITYKVTDGINKSYVLRIHKPSEGFNLAMLHSGNDRTPFILSEIKLLLDLAWHKNMQVQKVIQNIFGSPFSILNDGTPVTVLEWIEGTTLENMDVDTQIAYKLGVMIGRLHNVIAKKAYEHRYHYNGMFFGRMIDQLAKAAHYGQFGEQQALIMVKAMACIRDCLKENNSRMMMVHADLAKSNLVYNDGTIVPIDFSLSGYGIPEMDLASAFIHINDESLNNAILSGYKSVCEIKLDNSCIEVCCCFQALLFIFAQYKKHAGEVWFQDMLNNSCREYFVPLLATRAFWRVAAV